MDYINLTSAKEARVMAKDRRPIIVNQILAIINAEIETASNQGEYYTRYFGNIDADIMAILHDLGYSVVRVEPEHYLISWSVDFGKDDDLDDLIENLDVCKTIQIKYFSDEIDKIQKIENGDWIDLRAAETIELKAGEFALINLGIGMILPEGYEAHIVPRSSTFKKWGIIQTNHMGVIDESYCGENDQWKFPAYALRDTIINKNDRICQFRIVKKQGDIKFKVVEKLSENSRGGFGSTGVN